MLNNNFSIDVIPQKVASGISRVRLQEYQSRKWGLLGIDTGIHPLNMAIGGLLPGCVTTLGGLPSHGKTATMTPLLEASFRYTDKKPEFLVFTWEMEASRLTDRLISMKTGLSSTQLMLGAKLLTDSDNENIEKAIEQINQIPVYYQQHSLNSEKLVTLFEEFVDACNEATKEDGIERQPIGIIDYVGLADLTSTGNGLRTNAIGDMYRDLKQCANRTGGHWLIYAQLDKSARGSLGYPVLDNLAESQNIERSSDNIILIYRAEQDGKATIMDPSTGEEQNSQGKMLFRVVKCRLFGISDFVAGCDISRNKFWDIDYGPDVEYWKYYEQEDFWRAMLNRKING